MDISGRVFGRLTALRRVGTKRYTPTKTDVIWLCSCSCGVEVEAYGCLLRSGAKTSCGCKRREELGARRRTHGLTKTKEYQAWEHMHRRCSTDDPTTRKYYKDKGIKVCDAWTGSEGFVTFLQDVGHRPGPKYSLDRIDVSKGYEPGNVRWATHTTQMRNTTRNRVLVVDGESRCLSEWAEIRGIGKATICSRLRTGWDVADAVNLPRGSKNPKLEQPRG